jgi:hypothetical protein
MDTLYLRVFESVSDEELHNLFSNAWEDHVERSLQPVLYRSLFYVCAHVGDELIGFVNVATDGGLHTFILDTCVKRC